MIPSGCSGIPPDHAGRTEVTKARDSLSQVSVLWIKPQVRGSPCPFQTHGQKQGQMKAGLGRTCSTPMAGVALDEL